MQRFHNPSFRTFLPPRNMPFKDDTTADVADDAGPPCRCPRLRASSSSTVGRCRPAQISCSSLNKPNGSAIATSKGSRHPHPQHSAQGNNAGDRHPPTSYFSSTSGACVSVCGRFCVQSVVSSARAGSRVRRYVQSGYGQMNCSCSRFSDTTM